MEYTVKDCSHILRLGEQQQRGNLFLGGVSVLRDPKLKDKLHINCVVSVIDTKAYKGCKIKNKVECRGVENHKWFEIDDIVEESIFPYLEEGCEYIGSELEKGNVLVHCMVGKSRSASMVIAFLMKQLRLCFEEARDRVRSKRDIIKPNHGFIGDLYRFQKQLFEKESKLDLES